PRLLGVRAPRAAAAGELCVRPQRALVGISLETGVWLEDRGAGLAWGSTLDELRAALPPDFWTSSRESAPADRLPWNGRVWGGLRCQVATSFGGPHRPQTVLRGVRLVFWPPEAIRSCPDGFRWLQLELVERFGLPASLRDDGEEGEALWQVGGVTVRPEDFGGFGGGHFVFVFRREGTAEPGAAPDPAT